MRKVILSTTAIFFLGILISVTSCKKQESKHSFSNEELAARIDAWLDTQKAGKLPNRAANIDLLRSNLNFSMARFEKAENDGQILVVPILDNFKGVTGIDKNAILNLVLLMDRTQRIKRGNVVLFTPGAGQQNRTPENTFYNIFFTAEPECNGKFQFLSLTGKPQYDLEYKNRHLVKSGLYQSKEKPGSSNRTSTICYDWYLVTTWYDENGAITDQTSVYLYTSCSNECGGNSNYMSLCAEDGGGGATDCCISDPDAELSTRIVSQTVSDVCGAETIDPTTRLPTKVCTHTWYFCINSALWYTWKYGSVETTVEQKEGGVWKFASVAHQGMTGSGTTPPCIGSTCTILSASPYFSGSTARMDLSYTLKFTYSCIVPGGFQTRNDHASSQWGAI